MRDMRRLSVFLAAVVALILGAAAPEASAQEFLRFSQAKMIFEENATAGDMGVQFFLDGEAWHRVIVFRPDGDTLIDVEVKGNARGTGLTELFSESAEPSFDKLPRAQFLVRFPAGQYNYLGRTVDGRWLVGAATLTHNIPAAPKIVAPAKDAGVDPRQPLVIRWDLVPNPPGSTIEAYQVIVEKDEEDERLRVLSIDMAKTDTNVTVPAGFLEPGKAYKFEVLAIESGGNQTISEGSFETNE
jgi:hypothetical protein